jgi:hypothetical protein
MTTGTSIIEDALKEIRVISVAVPSSPEQISHGLQKLQTMLQLWLDDGIEFEFSPITTAGENLDEPQSVRNAIVTNLAISLAGSYRAEITGSLQNDARKSLNRVKARYQEICVPDKVVSSTLPKGAGNSKGVDSRVFFPKGGTING